MLEDAGLIENREGRLELTPRGIRKIGQNSLADLFSKIMRDSAGRHAEDRVGIGHERTYTTKPYEFGDPFNLDIQRTSATRSNVPVAAHQWSLHPRTSKSSRRRR